MYESSSVFTLFWNILCNQLPGEVNRSFEEWLEKTQIVRMDTMGSQSSTKGTYTVKYGEDVYEFHGVDMPPPSGVFGTNYMRFVKVHLLCICLTASFRFIHRETSSHKYAVAWTTMWDQQLGNHGGGHFFISSHGIKVEAATNSVVVWNPKSWHETSLQQWDPNNPAIFQAGLAIVTPSGVSRLWEAVLDKLVAATGLWLFACSHGLTAGCEPWLRHIGLGVNKNLRDITQSVCVAQQTAAGSCPNDPKW
jgi:hypothetical protein